jgi:excisionase family DNA binding protein
MITMTDDDLMTPDEVADTLRISTRALRRLCQTRKITYVKSGRAVRFERLAVRDYIARNRISAMTRAELLASLLVGE